MKKLFRLFLLFACTRIHAGTVEDLNIVITDTGAGEYSYMVSQNEAGTDYTCGHFKFYGVTNLEFTLVCVDESSDWYLAELGQPFNSNTIAGSNFVLIAGWVPESVYYTTITSIPVGSFFLAVNTGLGFDDENRSVYGWAQFYNNGCWLELMDSAMAYETNGIVIGEPGSTPFTNRALISFADIIAIDVQKVAGPPTRERRDVTITTEGLPCGSIALEYISSTNADWIQHGISLPTSGNTIKTQTYTFLWSPTVYPLWQHFRATWSPE